MFPNNFSGRRRTTRSKTVVVDVNDLRSSEDLQNPCNLSDIKPLQPSINLFSPSRNEIYSRERSIGNITGQPKVAPVLDYSTENRTFAFGDLMNAFLTIEKTSLEDPNIIHSALKRFKTNDEVAVEQDKSILKMSIKEEIFPSLMDNPFIRNDVEITTSIMEGYGSKKFIG